MAIKILGSSFGGNPVSLEFCSPVVDKVFKRLDGWKKGFLSRGGRVTLIQSIFASYQYTTCQFSKCRVPLLT